MTHRDGGGKISSLFVKGRQTTNSTGQNFSFRFNAGSDNLTQVCDLDEGK